MQTGNYWIFEFQTHMPDGSLTGNVSTDSLVVVGDTLLDDVFYHVIHTDKPSANSVWYLRDDHGVIVNQWGSTILPPNPTDEIFNFHHYVLEGTNDTLFRYIDEFPSLDYVETNFGEVECMFQKASHMIFPLADEITHVDTTYYSSFGPVQRSYAYFSGAKMIGTLVDYHLE